MAGGIDWFRWHHGSVTDPKFGLIAKKAGVRVSDVIAMWAFVLETASADADRGYIGVLDFEAVDHLMGFDEGQALKIMDVMAQRGLIAESRITSWDKRQPKRERDTDNSAERTRAYRERQKETKEATANHVTPCDASDDQRNARGEESREEKEDGENDSAVLPCPQQEIIEAYHRLIPAGRQVREWTAPRQAVLRARWREKAARQKLEWWERFFTYVAASDFLTGKTHTTGRKPFEVSLDWLVKSENMAKVIEGAYENEKVAA